MTPVDVLRLYTNLQTTLKGTQETMHTSVQFTL
jgi:hypothetical protein